MPPGKEPADTLLAGHSLVLEEAEHRVAAEERGHLAVDERDRSPPTFVVPPAAADQRVEVGMPAEVVAGGLDDDDHAGQDLLAVSRSRSDQGAGGLVGDAAEAVARLEAPLSRARLRSGADQRGGTLLTARFYVL